MITIRIADVTIGRIIFQVDGGADQVFIADMELAVEMLTTQDIIELLMRAYLMDPNTHNLVHAERGVNMEQYMSFRNPFITMFRSEIVNNHITVVYTILQN